MDHNIPTWDEYFTNMLPVIAQRSKDSSQKLGAIIVGSGNQIVSTGYNSFPRGINDDAPDRQTRPDKYFFFAHAEENAITNAALNGVSTAGCRIYINWCPCATCARMIINAGITKVIIASTEIENRWVNSCYAAIKMFHEANVLLRLAGDMTQINNLTILDERR